MTQGHYRFRNYAANRDVPNGWLELQFYQTRLFILLALTVLSFGIMTLLAGIGWLTFQNPVAKRKAKIIFISAAVFLVFMIAMFSTIAHDGPAQPPHPAVRVSQ